MTDQPHPDPARYWKHRRRLAYAAMWCLVVTLIAALGGWVRPDSMPLLQSLSWVFAAIVASYYGGNAAEAFANRRP